MNSGHTFTSGQAVDHRDGVLWLFVPSWSCYGELRSEKMFCYGCSSKTINSQPSMDTLKLKSPLASNFFYFIHQTFYMGCKNNEN